MIEQPVTPYQYKFDFRNDPLKEPASMEDAESEDRELLSRIQAVDARLVTLKFGDQTERRRAMDAKRHMMDRRRFVSAWKQKHSPAPPQIVRITAQSVKDIPSTQLMRMVAKRVGHLENVFLSAQAFIRNETDETFAKLVESVESAERRISGDESGN